MDLRYVFIDEETEEYFTSVLPEEMNRDENRISIGVADEEDRVLGAISYIVVRYEYVIDWVYVVPEVRRSGIGSELLDKVIGTIMATGDLFPIMARFPYTETDHEVFSLFQSEERMMTSYSHERFMISPEEIANSPLLKKRSGHKFEVTSFFDLSEEKQQRILSEMRIENGYVIAHYDRWRESMVPEFCRCIFAGDELSDLVLVQKLRSGDLEISFAYSKNPVGLMDLFMSIASDAKDAFPDASLSFDAVNEKSLKLAKKIFPEAVSVPIFEAVYF